MRWAMFACICSLSAAAVVKMDDRPVEAVECSTTKGKLRFAIRRDWAPHGAARFIELVDEGFFTDHPLYR
jgi:hypothetical protein